MSGNGIQVHVEKISGDATGLLTVRPSQRINMKLSEGQLPFSILVQKASNVALPEMTNCRDVEVTMRGTMEKMQNLTVGPFCKFVVHNSTETDFTYNHVVVQTHGYLAIDKDDKQLVTIEGKTFDIRGGGKVGDR